MNREDDRATRAAKRLFALARYTLDEQNGCVPDQFINVCAESLRRAERRGRISERIHLTDWADKMWACTKSQLDIYRKARP